MGDARQCAPHALHELRCLRARALRSAAVLGFSGEVRRAWCRERVKTRERKRVKKMDT